MANTCTNIFYCKTENKENYNKVLTFLQETFDVNFTEEDEDGQYFESEFSSKWTFPELEFDQLVSALIEDQTLYLRILSHELCSEYASFRVYREGNWEIDF